VSAALEACLWPFEAQDQLAARLLELAPGRGRVSGERFELAYADVTPALGARARASVPAVLRAGAGGGGFLGVLGYDGERARLVSRDGRPVDVSTTALAAFLRAPVEAAASIDFDGVVQTARLPRGRAETVRAALARASLGAERVAEGTRFVRTPRSMFGALGAAGVWSRATLAFAGYAVELALFAALWWAIGARAVAAGAPPWVALVVGFAALILLRLVTSRSAGRLAIEVGRVLRERLLPGLLALDAEPLRAEGIGRLLGRVVETEALESLALGGGLTAAAGAFELAAGLVVLAFGVDHGAVVAPVLVVAAAIGAWLATRVARAQRRWSELRLGLTHDLVERMAGQRTLVAQQPPELWHRAEDAAVADYAAAGRALDASAASLAVVPARLFLIGAVLVVARTASAEGQGAGALAVSLGGALFVYGALRKLGQAAPALHAAALAWERVANVFVAAPAEAPPATAPPADAATAPASGAPLIAAHGLSFRYPGRATPVLADCALEIRRGDRVLLEGPSGGGKSTLGALLAGLRAPDAGALLLDGREQAGLGLARWRARVGSAPQFHDNHVFSASLLFNLLLGRAWPPRREDVAEAEAILRELDLAPLLARMPSGLEQLVGDSGWQLSHGERSRLFIARSLLQPLDARVLDESFAALDPETLERALACVLKRAETLVVIAHP
jgi:ATP-binding cassette subfamily B protein